VERRLGQLRSRRGGRWELIGAEVRGTVLAVLMTQESGRLQ
jgi:hypothetical protein